MRALIDTNIVLDLLLNRQPFAEAAAAIWNAQRQGRFQGYIAAITPLNLFYIARKSHSADHARELVRNVLQAFPVCALEASILREALKLPVRDYEDATQLATALAYGLDVVVTRDATDFRDSPVPALSPATFLAQLA